MDLFKRKLTCRLAACIGAAALMLGVGPVWAVHDGVPPILFELDGDAVDSLPPSGGSPNLPDDWDTVLLGGGGTSDITTGVITDPTGNDETTHFKGGDKDTLDIPKWDIVTQNDTPKDDIEHAYAAAYTDPDTGHLIIYAGDDRFAQAGDASHGYWFFKNPVAINGSKFSGQHADGDVLVAVEFAQGGRNAIIAVFRWETQPVGNAPNLQEVIRATVPITSNVPFCNSAVGSIPADVVCGIANTDTETSPWFYFSSSGDPQTDEDFPPQAFLEIGIDITELTGETCFASFLATSRSSSSPTSTIKDFVLDSFPLCGVEVGKACVGNPTVVDGTKLETTFNVPITSTGSGTIHEVTLAEVPQPPLGAGESCRITAIELKTGAVPAFDPGMNGFPFNGITPVTVYDSLGGNTTATVTVKCVTEDRNPFIDKVAVTAKSSSSLTTPDLSDDHTTGQGETCAFVGNADVMATKCCESVTMDPDTFVPEVCVNITLTNNSSPAEALENIKVVDDVLGTVLTNGTLAASGVGASTTISRCYTPTSADQTGDPVAADTITFTDHVTEVSGKGAVSGDPFSLTGVALPSATCNLCPPQNQPCQ